MVEAKKQIKSSYLPTTVEHIPGEFWKNRNIFINILKNHGVTHIADYENYSEIVTLDTYIKGLK